MKGTKYIQMNVRSLLPKFQLLENDLLDGGIDVVCFTETWLRDGIPDSLISNELYNLIRYDRTVTNSKTNVRKMGGGIALYIKKEITYELYDSVCTKDIELCIVKLTTNGNKKQTIILVYRPPGGNVASAVDTINSHVGKFQDKYNRTEYIILGDFNINYLDKRSSQVKLLKNLEKMYGLSHVIQEPTRVTLQKSTLIDLCLTNMKNMSHSGVVYYFLSDHFPIFVVKKKTKIREKEL